VLYAPESVAQHIQLVCMRFGLDAPTERSACTAVQINLHLPPQIKQSVLCVAIPACTAVLTHPLKVLPALLYKSTNLYKSINLPALLYKSTHLHCTAVQIHLSVQII
jgi:hypothetical protein